MDSPQEYPGERPPYVAPTIPPPPDSVPVPRREGKPKRRSGRMFTIAGVLVVVGLAMGVPSMVAGWSVLGGLLNLERHDVPGSFSVDIDEPGDYTIFVLSGSQQQTGFVTTSNSFTVEIEDVGVTSPSGAVLTTFPVFNTYIQLENEQFSSAVSFEADAVGRYDIVLDTDPATVAVVSKSLAFPRLGLILLGVASGLTVLSGLVVGLIAFFRRREERSSRSIATDGSW